MTRTFALFCGLLWLVGLIALDATILVREDALRQEVDRLLAERFAVPVRYAALRGDPWRGFRIEGLRVDHPDRRGPCLEATTIRLSLDWGAALRGASPLHTLRIEGLRVHVGFDGSGRPEFPNLMAEVKAPREPAQADRSAPPTPWIQRIEAHGLDIVLVDPPTAWQPLARSTCPRFTALAEPSGAALALRALWRTEDGFSIEVDGRVGAGGVELDAVLGLDLATSAWRERLPQDLARELLPWTMGGRLQAKARIEQAPEAALEWAADLVLDGGRCTRIPYDFPVEQVSAKIQLSSERIVCEGGTGTFAGTPLRFDWSLDPRNPMETAKARIALDGLALEEEFLSRLDPRRHPSLPQEIGVVRRELDRYEARGIVDVVVDVRADRGREEGYALRAAVDLRDVRFRYMGDLRDDGSRDNAFDYLVQKLTGRLVIDGKCLTIEDVRSGEGLSEVRAFGVADIRDPVDETYAIIVEARGVPIDERLLRALPARLSAAVRDLQPEGALDARITVSRMPGEKLAQPALVHARFKDLKMTPLDFPVALEGVTGAVRGGAGTLYIDDLTGRCAGGSVRVDGLVGTSLIDRRIELQASVSGLPLDAAFQEALSTQYPLAKEQLERFALAGTLDRVEATLRRASTGGRMEVRGSLVCSDLQAKVPGADLPIEALSLRLAVQPEVVGHSARIAETSSFSTLGIPWTLSGRIDTEGTKDLRFTAAAADFDQTLVNAIAPLVRELEDPARRPRLAGRVKDGVVRLRTDPTGPPSVQVELGFENVVFQRSGDARLALEETSGRFRVSDEGIEVRDVRAVVTPGPRWTGASSTRAVLALGRLSQRNDGRMAVEGFTLGDVPLERWVFEGLGLLADDEPMPAVRGTVALFAQAIEIPSGEGLGPRIRGGGMQARALRFGEESEVFVESLSIEAAESDRAPMADWVLRAEVRGRGARVHDFELPSFESDFLLMEKALQLDQLGAAVFRETADPPPSPLTPRAELLSRVIANGVISAEEAERWTDAALRRWIEQAEGTSFEGLSLPELRRAVVQRGLLSRRASATQTEVELLELLRAEGHVRPGGWISPPSSVALDFEARTFDAALHLDPFDAASLARALGEADLPIKGRLRGHVSVQGHFDRLAELKGYGTVSATVRDLFDVPAFFAVLEGLDVVSYMDNSPWVRIAARFSIADEALKIDSGTLEARALRLGLVDPARIGFDGSLRATVAVEHVGRTPFLAPIMGLLPKAIGNRIAIQGTVQQPVLGADPQRE